MNETDANDAEPAERFVGLITEHQSRMFGYVYSLLGDRTAAADVLQETNMVLWRKMSEYRTAEPFVPWAFAIARFQVLAYLRDQKRDRCVLNAELVEMMSSDVEQQASELDAIRTALQQCMESLASEQRELIQSRYFEACSIQQIAESLDRGTSAVKTSLMRIRRQLGECIERRMAAE